jgi:hypothetical protein
MTVDLMGAWAVLLELLGLGGSHEVSVVPRIPMYDDGTPPPKPRP